MAAVPPQGASHFKAWPYLKDIYLTTYRAIEEIQSECPQRYIFTNVWFEGVEEHEEIIRAMESMALKCQLPLYHFILECQEAEYYKRAMSPQRKERLKETDRAVLEHLYTELTLLKPKAFRSLDVSQLSAAQAVQHLVEDIPQDLT